MIEIAIVSDKSAHHNLSSAIGIQFAITIYCGNPLAINHRIVAEYKNGAVRSRATKKVPLSPYCDPSLLAHVMNTCATDVPNCFPATLSIGK